MPRFCIKNSDTVVFGILRLASSSRTISYLSLLTAAHPHSTSSGVLLVAGLPECESLSIDLDHLWGTCVTLLFALHFWIIQIVSAGECSSLMQHLMKIHCSTCSFWMWQPHSTHAHSTTSTAPYSEVVIVHACTFLSTLLGCQLTSMSRKPFSVC